MPSKKHILLRLKELEKELEQLRFMIIEHYGSDRINNLINKIEQTKDSEVYLDLT